MADSRCENQCNRLLRSDTYFTKIAYFFFGNILQNIADMSRQIRTYPVKISLFLFGHFHHQYFNMKPCPEIERKNFEINVNIGLLLLKVGFLCDNIFVYILKG